MIKEILKELTNKNILVIGDIMLDKYIIGNVSRISPEAPIPIVDVNMVKYKLGGAANVANNLICTNANVLLFGVVGNDDAAVTVKGLLDKTKIKNHLVTDVKRSTTLKTRVVSNGQQIVRYDKEDIHTINSNIYETLARVLKEQKDIDAVIISDYGKGTISKRVVKLIIELFKGAVIVVDPKPEHQIYYKGVNFITPNIKEFSTMNPDKLPYTKFIITLGADGVSYDKDIFPSVAKEVCDVSGAGDTFIAIFTAMYCVLKDVKQSIEVANKASGVVVGKQGTSNLDFNELVNL